MELLWLVVMGLFAYVLIGNITQFFENENSPLVQRGTRFIRFEWDGCRVER